MRINRNNYEMFFLLYVDKELSAQDQRGVEAFASANADLAAELDALMKTRLYNPLHIVYGDKQSLYKTAAVQIDVTNYEDYFLQYIDNELNAEQKTAVEKFIITHPQYAEELNILKQTVLPAEETSFVNKQILYRTEERERRVIPFKILRLAIAAAFIGIAAMVWWLVPAVKKDITPVAINTSEVKKQPLPGTKKPAPQLPQQTEVAAQQQPANKKENKLVVSATINKPVEKKFAVTKHTVLNNKENLPEPVIAVQQAVQQPEVVTPTVTTGTVEVNKSITAKNEILKPLIETDVDKTKVTEAAYAATEKNNLVQPAVYKELDTDEDDTQTLYVGGLELNKDKVKGFFKKATKLFSSKVKTETSNSDSKL